MSGCTHRFWVHIIARRPNEPACWFPCQDPHPSTVVTGTPAKNPALAPAASLADAALLPGWVWCRGPVPAMAFCWSREEASSPLVDIK